MFEFRQNDRWCSFFAIEKESVHEIVWARKTWELSATASQIWAGMATIFTSGREVTQTK